MLDLILADPKNKEIYSFLKYLGYSSALKVVLFHPKNSSDFKQLKKILSSNALVIGVSQDEKLIRRLLEDKRVDGIMNVESSGGRDHTHYRRGNINQVLAKIAYEKEKFYLIDFSRILKMPIEKRYILLGRIMQNIRIFQKYNVPISIASFAKDVYGLKSRDSLKAFARILGSKKTESINNLINKKQDKLNGKIIRKGVKILN